MKFRIWIGVVLLILIAAGGLGIYAWNAKPELMEVYPPAGAENISSTAPIRMVFSRSMEQATVIGKLSIDPATEGAFSWAGSTLTFTPDHPWPGGKEIKLQLAAGARAASWLSFPLEPRSWSFKTSQESLVYLWPSDGASDIYALDITTGEKRKYTLGMGVLDYALSQDGRMIFFSASNFQAGADLYQLDRTILDSSADHPYQARELLNCSLAQCRNPVVSPDGKYLAYEYILPSPGGDLGSAQVWLLNLATSKATAIGETSHETVQPSWSSTGWLAYYDRTSKAYELVNPITQVSVELPNQTGQPGSWSQDGKFYLAPEISYLPEAGGTETGSSHLICYSTQSQASQDISGAAKVEDVDAIYSPDGSLIAFARKYLDAENWSFGRQLWIMNADGSNQHPITNEPDYNHYDLAWSRDGAMLAYVRFNQVKLSDPPELWMANDDGSNAVLLVVGGYSPRWMP